MSLTPQEEQHLRPHDLEPGPYVSYMTRRETHSSRAIISVIVALVVLVAMVYLCIEGILGLLHKKPLLLSWSHMARFEEHIPRSTPVWALIIAGVIFVLIGLFLLAKAFLPGTLGRHSLDDRRAAYVVDDAVIASAVSRFTRRNFGLDQGQVSTRVDRRSITVTVTPTSGIRLSQDAIQKTVASYIQSYGLQPDAKLHVRLQSKGMVSK